MEPLFNAFATAAFFEFVTFAIFEMRYLLSIWRARRGSALDAWAAQRELSLLYVRFYGALLGGIFLTYQLRRRAPEPQTPSIGFRPRSASCRCCACASTARCWAASS